MMRVPSKGMDDKHGCAAGCLGVQGVICRCFNLMVICSPLGARQDPSILKVPLLHVAVTLPLPTMQDALQVARWFIGREHVHGLALLTGPGWAVQPAIA